MKCTSYIRRRYGRLRLSVAQRCKRQAGAADHSEHCQDDQRQSRALQPMLEGCGQAVAFGQPQGPMLNPCRQVAARAAGQSVGFQILQGPGVFFTQAHGFGQPEVLQWRQFSHATFRCSIEL